MDKPKVKYAEVFGVKYEKDTVADLAERYSKAFKLSTNQLSELRVLQRAPIASVNATKLTRNDYREHAVLRKANGVQTFLRRSEPLKELSGATVGKDFGLLSVIFTHAKDYWDVPIDLELLKQARRKLKKEKLIAKSKKRKRRPTADELAMLLAHFAKQNDHERTQVDMVIVTEFSYEAGRRISETCRIRRKDVNLETQTYTVFDLKNPNGKGVHHTFVLVGRALELVKERLAVIPEHPEARLFPFSSKTCSARYTEAKRKLGIKDLRLHDNRRECFSRRFAEGHTVTEVQHGWSGHVGDAKTLQDTYTQVKPEEILARVREIEQRRSHPQ